MARYIGSLGAGFKPLRLHLRPAKLEDLSESEAGLNFVTKELSSETDITKKGTIAGSSFF